MRIPGIHRVLGKKTSLLFLVNRSEVRARLTFNSPFRHSLIKSLINASINQNSVSAYCLVVLRHARGCGKRTRKKKGEKRWRAARGNWQLPVGLLLRSLAAVRPAN